MFSSSDIANYLLKTLATLKDEISALQAISAANSEQQRRDRDDIEYLKKELSQKPDSSEIVTKGELSELKSQIAIGILTLLGGGVAVEFLMKLLGL